VVGWHACPRGISAKLAAQACIGNAPLVKKERFCNVFCLISLFCYFCGGVERV